MIRAAENYTVRVRGDFWIRAKRPVKGGLKNHVETMYVMHAKITPQGGLSV